MPAKSYCIICGDPKSGLGVKNDHVLETVRWFKKNVTKNEKGYALVVCKDDYPEWKKRRSKFETRRVLYVGLGVVFAVVAFVLSPKPDTLLVGIGLILLLYLFALLSYMPALDIKKQK